MNDDLFSMTAKPATDETPDKARIDSLRKSLDKHNELYYAKATPEISDREYDQLMAELVALERKHPELMTPDSPSVRVGGRPLSEFKPYEHMIPMQSLENTYARGEVAEFDSMLKNILGVDSIEYVVEPKIDGLAFAVHYIEGILATAATRGNSEVGDEVTENVKTIRSIPLRIDTEAAFFEVRGEIYMPKSGFLKLTEEQIARDEEPFKNPRNAAAGSIKLLDPSLVAKRPLNAVMYGIGRVDGVVEPKTQVALTEQLRNFSMPVQPKTWLCRSIDDVFKAIDELEALRHDFDFEMDGAVIKVNDRSLYKRLGSTAKAPRWARAYKYAPEQAETEIEAITVQVGRTGVLTPVAELRTVRLSGSDISRATLHNEDEIRRKDIRVGDHVMIEKAGEVIPAVVSVLTAKRTGTEIEFRMPGQCPECGEPAIRLPGEVATRCMNFLCPAQLAARVTHFASRDGLDIEGLGDRVAQALVEQNLISNPMDLFDKSEILLATLNLESSAGKVTGAVTTAPKSKASQTLFEIGGSAEGRILGEANAKTIMQAIQRSKTLPLSRWIYAIGIPGVGSTAASDIAKMHDDFKSFANSTFIAEAKKLYDLMEQADLNNPNTQRVRALDVASRVACADNFTRISNEIETLGSTMIAEGIATRVKGSSFKFSCVIKPEVCRAIDTFLHSSTGLELVARMERHGINPLGGTPAMRRAKAASPATLGLFEEPPANSKDAFFDGKTLVITGSFHDGLGRSDVATLITDAGGRVTESVSDKTDYLVVGENPGASKTSKAAKLGTPIIDETTLREKLGLPPCATQSTLC